METLDLFADIDERAGRARSTDPDTSRQGAASVAYRAGSQKHRLLDAYYSLPDATDEEAAKAAGLNLRSCFWKRSSELREDGLIEPVLVGGEPLTRRGDAGVERIVCRISRAGIETVKRLGEGK